MEADRTELSDLSAQYPSLVKSLSEAHDEWAERCSVLPWDELLTMRASKNA